MLNFQYYSPTRLIFGKGEEEKAGEYLKNMGAKKVMVIHYGTGLSFETVLIDRITKSLESVGLEYVCFSGIKPNPSLSRCRECAEEIKARNIDFLLAVGGGSVIDTAKFAAVQAKYDGDLWEDCFYKRNRPVPQQRVPLGVVITLAGTGSEASEACLIRDEVSEEKLGVDNDVMRPVFAIMNPELTYTLPQYQTACGIADIFCHMHESYWTHTEDGTFMDEYLESMMRTVIKHAEIVIREPDNYLARAQILFMGTMANWHLTWCGRVDDGSIHFIQEPISAKYDTAHGHGCAVVTLGWLRYASARENPNRFVRYFNRVWNIPVDELHPQEVIRQGLEKQKQFYKMLGLGTTLESVGVKREDVRWLAEHAMTKPHGKTGNYILLGPDEIVDVYELCDHEW